MSTDDLMKQKKWLTVAIVVPAVFFTAFIVRYFIAYNRGESFPQILIISYFPLMFLTIRNISKLKNIKAEIESRKEDIQDAIS